MTNDIQLNFLPLEPNEFRFQIYRKLYGDNVKVTDKNIYVYRLPVGNKDEYLSYLISFSPKAGFSSFECHSKANVHLSERFLLHLLLSRLRKQKALHYLYDEDRFSREVEFVIEELPQGKRLITFQPYYLKTKRKLGFLINYRFRKAADVPFDRDIQRLSLSLDRQYKANTKYYTDKFHLLRRFIVDQLVSLFPLSNHDFVMGITTEFELLPALSLEKKVYVLHNNNTSTSQFLGLKRYGPVASVSGKVHYVFIFEKRFRDFANDLYLGLLGKRYGGLFPGLRELFDLNIAKDDVSQVPLKVYTRKSLDDAFKNVLRINEEKPDCHIIGVFITPEQEIEMGETTAYYYLKHLFAGSGLSLQVVNYERQSNTNTLKWSLANIGLQIFCKLGGVPWRVQPSNEKCLIIGMGSAHRSRDDGTIRKYFGYSVCLDSSGVFQKINVLAYHEDRSKYLEELRRELAQTIRDDIAGSYTKCVLHLPFKIQREEIATITECVNEVSSDTNVDFRVIKINTENKFFGFSSHNTRIPYESTYVRLSFDEYLAWFEGLLYGKENVNNKVGNPVHIQFLRTKDEDDQEDKTYLQDIINLSGANWRGFNSKLIPISIYYSSLVAGYAKQFEEIEDLSTVKTEISNITSPWFL